jgi:tetratricopeptide (TPR) repeat protein
MACRHGSGFLKMFGEEGMRKIAENPITAPFLNDPVFAEMIEDIAEHPENIVKYQQDPRLQPALMYILPMMLSAAPVGNREAPGPLHEVSPDAETAKDRGNECFRSGDYVSAIQYYNQAINIDSKNLVYYSNKAAALNKLKQFEDAMEAALLAVEVGRENNAPNEQVAKAYVRLATAAQGCGKNNGALTALRESLFLHEDTDVRKYLESLEQGKK